MADNVNITPGSGNIVAADEVTDGTLGTVKVQYTKLMDGTIDSTNKLIVSSAGAAKVDGSAVTQPISATSLPLPTGAATSANQTTGNTSLGSLVTNSNDIEATINFTAVGQTVQIALEGHTSVAAVLTSMGTGGQIVLEGSLDNVGWFSLDQYAESAEQWQSNTITATGNYWTESIGALGYMRARCTVLTSGTITGLLIGSTMAMGTFEFQGSPGQGLPFNAVLSAGKTNDGTPQFRELPLGTTGRSVIVEGVSGGTAVSVNNTQLIGTAISVNNGTTDAGTQRVTLSSDSTGQVKLATGANTIGALTANQSVNVAQINGNATVTAATGVQKVGIVGNAGATIDAAGQNAASPTNEILIGGQFNTTPTAITNGNMSPLQLNAQGALIVENTTSTKAVFAACASTTTPAATTTDFMTIYGSASKTVRVLKIEIAYTATALADLKIFIVKRSATNTGGTSSAPTIPPFDSNNTVTATVLVYTANPTALGASVGTVSAADILVGGTTTVTAAQLMYTFDFTNSGVGSGIILRGTSQGLAVNMNGAAVPTGGSVNTCNITWIEE